MSTPDVIEQPEPPTAVRSSDLLAALARSIRKTEYATSCVTVLKTIRVGKKRAQIQLKVTTDKDDWFDIKHAGVKCS